MALDKIERVSKVGKKLKIETLPQEPNRDYFDALMRQRKVSAEVVADVQASKDVAKVNSLFDEVRDLGKKTDHVTRSSPNELAAQAEDVVSQIDLLKNKLETPNLEIKGSVQTVLRDKLTHIDENLKIALNKAGIEYTPPQKATSLSTPMERFLGLLTHSQNQLATLAGDVHKMAQLDHQLSPATMLLIQIKVGYIQQEIELFTSMLNKALESTKTIMNVQV
ncbi:MAG TPA: hypothetical protein VIH61_05425 [Waddliaceae bacterium]